MTDLDHDLRALSREIDWPPTPDLAAAVRQGAARAPRRGAHPFAPRRVVIAIALLALLLPATALAIPASRHAVLDAFGLRHVTVERARLRASLATIVSSHGRNGAPSRNRPSAR